MKSDKDPGIDWIRKVRHEISAEFDHDPKKLGDHYRELEKEYADRLVKPSEQKREPENALTK